VLVAERRRQEAEQRVAEIEVKTAELRRLRAEQEEESTRLSREARILEGKRLSLADLRGELETRLGALDTTKPLVVDTLPSAGWTVVELERLVAEHKSDFPDETPEWESYLAALSQQADPHGRLPGSLDELVMSVFEPLLAERRSA
jgi:chromosome segregation ATPase